MERKDRNTHFPSNFQGLPTNNNSAIAESYQLAIDKLNQELKNPIYPQRFREVKAIPIKKRTNVKEEQQRKTLMFINQCEIDKCCRMIVTGENTDSHFDKLIVNYKEIKALASSEDLRKIEEKIDKALGEHGERVKKDIEALNSEKKALVGDCLSDKISARGTDQVALPPPIPEPSPQSTNQLTTVVVDKTQGPAILKSEEVNSVTARDSQPQNRKSQYLLLALGVLVLAGAAYGLSTVSKVQNWLRDSKNSLFLKLVTRRII